MPQNYRKTKPLLHFGILAFIYGIGLLTLATHTALHATSGHSAATPTHAHVDDHCHGSPSRSHTVVFSETAVSPAELSVKRCDAVVIKNELPENLIPAIGTHENHQHYPGFSEQLVSPGQSYTFRAARAGSYVVHNHNDDTQKAVLTVQ